MVSVNMDPGSNVFVTECGSGIQFGCHGVWIRGPRWVSWCVDPGSKVGVMVC